MTDFTINIKTGSKNSKPKFTTTTDNTNAVVLKTESPKEETPKAERKDETASGTESPNKDDSKKWT